MSFWAERRVLVTGAHGFFGSHVVEALRRRAPPPLSIATPSAREADLRERTACARVVHGVDVVVHLAARVGGIGMHEERPGEVLHDTALMGLQLLEAARCEGVQVFVGIGSTCSYPRLTPVPFREEALWDGPLDPTTGGYGLAKKLLLVQGQAYRRQYGFEAIHLIPVNLYGPRDHFDPHHGHVVPALVRRFTEAVETGSRDVTVWGSGLATRDFLYVEDAAEAVLLACEHYRCGDPVNLGSGREVAIHELATIVADATGYRGDIRFDPSRPDGQPRRCVDVTRARERLLFEARTPLELGIRRTVDWFRRWRSTQAEPQAGAQGEAQR